MRRELLVPPYVVATACIVWAAFVGGWAGAAALLVAAVLVGWIAFWGAKADRGDGDRQVAALAAKVDTLSNELQGLKVRLGFGR